MSPQYYNPASKHVTKGTASVSEVSSEVFRESAKFEFEAA